MKTGRTDSIQGGILTSFEQLLNEVIEIDTALMRHLAQEKI